MLAARDGKLVFKTSAGETVVPWYMALILVLAWVVGSVLIDKLRREVRLALNINEDGH